MPNWCDCDLYVAGSESDLIAFEEKARGVNRLLDANNFVPYPEKFRQMDADHPGWSPPKDATEEQTAEFEVKKLRTARSTVRTGTATTSVATIGASTTGEQNGTWMPSAKSARDGATARTTSSPHGVLLSR